MTTQEMYQRWFEDDWSEKKFKKLNFTQEEAQLFSDEEYRVFKQSPEGGLNGGYFYFKVLEEDILTNEDDTEIEVLCLSMVWGIEGEHQDYGTCYFDRTNKKFLYKEV